VQPSDGPGDSTAAGSAAVPAAPVGYALGYAGRTGSVSEDEAAGTAALVRPRGHSVGGVGAPVAQTLRAEG